MAGHSKWANIKHRKERADALKGKLFSRVAKEIITSVKLGGSDPKTNSRLRAALQKAKSVNMSNDSVERNIKKASQADQSMFVEAVYELYGHGGVGIIVEVMTDNRNKTASDLRVVLNKKGGSQAVPGAVVFNFDHLGVIRVAKQVASEERLLEVVSQAGAEDLEATDDEFVILTPSDHLFHVKELLDAQQIPAHHAELEWIPKVWIDCNEEQRQQNSQLIQALEALDDVDAVYTNMS